MKTHFFALAIIALLPRCDSDPDAPARPEPGFGESAGSGNSGAAGTSTGTLSGANTGSGAGIGPSSAAATTGAGGGAAAGSGSGGGSGVAGTNGGTTPGGGGTSNAGPSDAAVGSDTATTDVGPSDRCAIVPKCDAAPPNPGAARAWRHSAPSGASNHRGRDLFVNPGQPQWIVGRFQYGIALFESSLQDEEVDIYLLRGCGTSWEKLGTALTTGATPSSTTIEGVSDAAGRIFFQIPSAKALAVGRHRIRLVVGGDLSAVDLFIEVVPSGAPAIVTDVDGTLTTSENAETLALLTGSMPDANADAAQVLTLLASKGYRPFYLTARPEWLVQTTRDWIVAKGFPPGILHTTLVSGGATGDAAGTFKTDELRELAMKGMKPAFSFGNTASDADAYNNASIAPLTNRIFFQFTDATWHGRRVEAYGPLLAELGGLAPACR